MGAVPYSPEFIILGEILSLWGAIIRLTFGRNFQRGHLNRSVRSFGIQKTLIVTLEKEDISNTSDRREW